MAVVSLRGRLERAISKLPDKPEPMTQAQIEAQIISAGGNPKAVWDWMDSNPDATQLERVRFFSGHASFALSPTNKIWTERQATNFLAWQAEQEKSNPRYFRSR